MEEEMESKYETIFIGIMILAVIGVFVLGVLNLKEPKDLIYQPDPPVYEFVWITGNLYYDNTTYIVYMKNSNGAAPYYAENGVPYKYNTSSGELEMIDVECYKEENNLKNIN